MGRVTRPSLDRDGCRPRRAGRPGDWLYPPVALFRRASTRNIRVFVGGVPRYGPRLNVTWSSTLTPKDPGPQSHPRPVRQRFRFEHRGETFDDDHRVDAPLQVGDEDAGRQDGSDSLKGRQSRRQATRSSPTTSANAMSNTPAPKPGTTSGVAVGGGVAVRFDVAGNLAVTVLVAVPPPDAVPCAGAAPPPLPEPVPLPDPVPGPSPDPEPGPAPVPTVGQGVRVGPGVGVGIAVPTTVLSQVRPGDCPSQGWKCTFDILSIWPRVTILPLPSAGSPVMGSTSVVRGLVGPFGAAQRLHVASTGAATE